MARIEISFIALCLGKLAKTQIMFDSLLQRRIDVLLLVLYKHIVLRIKWGSFDPKMAKFPWHSFLNGRKRPER